MEDALFSVSGTRLNSCRTVESHACNNNVITPLPHNNLISLLEVNANHVALSKVPRGSHLSRLLLISLVPKSGILEYSEPQVVAIPTRSRIIIIICCHIYDNFHFVELDILTIIHRGLTVSRFSQKVLINLIGTCTLFWWHLLLLYSLN